jgi:hypothetical protein
VNAEGPDPRRNGARDGRTDGHDPATAPADPERRLAGRVSRLDRVTLQLGVAVAVVIALCSYAVSATSLYALGRRAGYSPWQAAAVPVVADGPAIYGMFRIVSRSRRGARGAGYGWLLVIAGTLASIGGNVAHAQPDLVAQAIAAAIPLAVLAMLEGLKGDAGEVTRLTRRRRPGHPNRSGRCGRAGRPGHPCTAADGGHHRPPHRHPGGPGRRPSGPLARPGAPRPPRPPGRWRGPAAAGGRLPAGPSGRAGVDGQIAGRGRRLRSQHRCCLPPNPAGRRGGAGAVKVRLHGTPAEVDQAARRLVEVLDVVSVSEPYPDRGASVLVRVYLEVRLDPATPATPPGPGRTARRPRRALP